MKINSNTGLITTAIYMPSPNFDERPLHTEIDLLVIHGISLPPGEFGGDYIKDFFLNSLNHDQHRYFKEIAHLKVSTHLFINREGIVYQFVPFTQRAWHAGQSTFLGRSNCNDYSIGIELEGTDEIPYTMQQYKSLTNVTRAILDFYPKITLDRIVGHSDIAPVRKTDPGPAFEWQQYREMVSQNTNI